MADEPQRIGGPDGEHVRVPLAIESQRPTIAATFVARTSTTGNVELPVDTSMLDEAGVVFVDVPAVHADGPAWALRLDAATGTSMFAHVSATIRFVDDGAVLTHEGFQAHLDRITDDRGVLHGSGSARTIPLATLVHHPKLSDDVAQVLVDAGAPHTEEIGTTSGALRGSPGAPRPANHPSGCHGGSADVGAVAILFGLGLIVLRVRRRRCWMATAAIAVVAAPATAGAQSEQRHVVGYAAFWDARSPTSDLPGSRAPTCDSSDTQCFPIDGPSCCFRSLPNVTVVAEHNGVVLDTYEAHDNGFFYLSFTSSDSESISFIIRYHRDDDPGLTRLTLAPTQLGLSAPPAETLALKAALVDTWTTFARLSVNGAHDVASVPGDLASVWATVTETQDAITAEGDTRFRRAHGADPSDPDDLLLIRYTALKIPWFPCDQAVMNTYDGTARAITPAAQQGALYHGRVVGCASGGAVGLYNYPAFPPNPGTPHMQSVAFDSEGIALALSYASLVGLLNKWDPDVATVDAVKGASGFDCVPNLLPNSNEAASIANTTLALWELIDTDTSGAGGGTDTTDLTLAQLMDGLAALSQMGGAPGDNHTADEPIYTPTTTPCDGHFNEDCDPGDACLNSGTGQRCHTGDPHGGNIYDATLWTGMLALVNGWTGAGDVLGTIDASACFVGGPDNTFPYGGSYRTD